MIGGYFILYVIFEHLFIYVACHTHLDPCTQHSICADVRGQLVGLSSPHHVASRDRTKAIRLDSKCLHPQILEVLLRLKVMCMYIVKFFGRGFILCNRSKLFSPGIYSRTMSLFPQKYDFLQQKIPVSSTRNVSYLHRVHRILLSRWQRFSK